MKRLALLLVLVSVGCRSTDKLEQAAFSTQPATVAVSWEYAPDSAPDLTKAALTKALDQARQRNQKDPTLQGLVDEITLERLASESLVELTKTAQRLIAASEGRPVPAPVSSQAQLELAIQAIKESKFSLAAYHLDHVRKSPVKEQQAAVATAEGIMALRDGRLDVAAQRWKDAIVAVPTYKAARLNLGFLYLHAGNAAAARRMLEPLRSDWFAASGLLVAARVGGDYNLADTLCKDILAKNPSHAPTLINCAIQRFQIHNDKPEADLLLSRVITDSSRPEVSEYAYLLRNRYRQTTFTPSNRVTMKQDGADRLIPTKLPAVFSP